MGSNFGQVFHPSLWCRGCSITVICVLAETCSVEKVCWAMNKRFQRKCFLVSTWQLRAGYTYEVCQGWTRRYKDTRWHSSFRSCTFLLRYIMDPRSDTNETNKSTRSYGPSRAGWKALILHWNDLDLSRWILIDSVIFSWIPMGSRPGK